jgi:hypothetical protein
MQADPKIEMVPRRRRQIGKPRRHRFVQRLDRGEAARGVRKIAITSSSS